MQTHILILKCTPLHITQQHVDSHAALHAAWLQSFFLTQHVQVYISAKALASPAGSIQASLTL